MGDCPQLKDVGLGSEEKIIKIIHSLRPVLAVEKIYGIRRFTNHKQHIVPTNWKKKLYSIAVVAINIIAFSIFNIVWYEISGINKIDLIYQIPCLVVLIQYTVTTTFTTLFFNKDNRLMILSLANLDARLRTSDQFYRRGAHNTKKWLIMLVVPHILCSILDFATNQDLEPRDLTFFPLFLVQKIENLMFCLAIELIRSRLSIINDYLETFIKEKNDIGSAAASASDDVSAKLNMIGRPSVNNIKIRDLALMYDTVGSICFTVNNIFNFQIFMTLASAFCYIVITIWASLYFFKTPENYYGALVTVIIWCSTTLLMVGLMCFQCERLRSMRNRTKILVNELIMDYSLPKTMRLQAKAFMELIEAWPLRIFVYDMFAVDISLMLKFISVSTTYLIVIIQVSHFNNVE